MKITGDSIVVIVEATPLVAFHADVGGDVPGRLGRPKVVYRDVHVVHDLL